MAQIGSINLQTENNGVVTLPVFDTADAGSGVYDMVRVQTDTGVGFIPFVDTADATFDYLRLQTQNQGVLGAHDSATLFTGFSEGFEGGSLGASQFSGTGTVQSGEVLSGSFSLEQDAISAGDTRSASATLDDIVPSTLSIEAKPKDVQNDIQSFLVLLTPSNDFSQFIVATFETSNFVITHYDSNGDRIDTTLTSYTTNNSYEIQLTFDFGNNTLDAEIFNLGGASIGSATNLDMFTQAGDPVTGIDEIELSAFEGIGGASHGIWDDVVFE